MDRREMKRMAREQKTEAGVYTIRNTQNGKRWVESTRNLRTINGQRFQLDTGVHRNQALQQEWDQFGADAFVIEVLEQLEREENESIYFDEMDELKKLKTKWLEELQPYGERGYN